MLVLTTDTESESVGNSLGYGVDVGFTLCKMGLYSFRVYEEF